VYLLQRQSLEDIQKRGRPVQGVILEAIKCIKQLVWQEEKWALQWRSGGSVNSCLAELEGMRKRVLEQFGDEKYEYLWMAGWERKTELVKWLVTGQDKEYATVALFVACEEGGDPELIDWLIEQGADASAKDLWGRTPGDYHDHPLKIF
jgi:hypothetical protein